MFFVCSVSVRYRVHITRLPRLPARRKHHAGKIITQNVFAFFVCGGDKSFLWGHYPWFHLLVKYLGFKARVGNLIHAWWMCICHGFVSAGDARGGNIRRPRCRPTTPGVQGAM